MRIAHIADTHLGYRQYNLEERESDVYDAFNEAIEKMIEERVDVFVHAGDFFDTPRPPIRALYVAKKGIKRLRDHGIKVLTVLGEHDTPRRRAMPPHPLLDLPVLGLGRVQKVVLDGVAFFGISNLKGRRIDLLKAELSKVDSLAAEHGRSVLIAHQAIKRFLPFEGAYELEMADLPRKITYYAFGHIHPRTIEPFGGGYLAYAGSTEIMRRSEIQSWRNRGKGFYIVDLDGDFPDVQEISLESVRPQFDLSYSQGDDVIRKLEAFLHRLLDDPPLKPPVLRLTVQVGALKKAETLEKIRGVLDKLVPEGLLRYTVHFVSSDGSIQDSKELNGLGDLKKLFVEYLGDEELGRLAFELYSHLWRNDVEGGIEACRAYLEGDGR